MTDDTRTQIESLATMKLPELRARYAEVLGEETRCPNKIWLVRQITAALEVQAAETIDAKPDADTLAKAKRWAEDAFLATDIDADGVAGELVERFEIPRASADEIVASVSQALDEEYAAGVAAEEKHKAELAAAGLPDVDDVPPGIGITVSAETIEPAAETRLSKLSVDALRAIHLELIGRASASSSKRYLVWRVRQAQKGRVTTGPIQRRDPGESTDYKVLPLRMEADLVAQLDEARERLGLRTRMDLFRRALAAYLGEQGEAEVAALFAQAE